jgi:hypothetical protein
MTTQNSVCRDSCGSQLAVPAPTNSLFDRTDQSRQTAVSSQSLILCAPLSNSTHPHYSSSLYNLPVTTDAPPPQPPPHTPVIFITNINKITKPHTSSLYVKYIQTFTQPYIRYLFTKLASASIDDNLYQ